MFQHRTGQASADYGLNTRGTQRPHHPDAARVEQAADPIREIAANPRLTATDCGKNSLGDQQALQQQFTHTPAWVPALTVDGAEQESKKGSGL